MPVWRPVFEAHGLGTHRADLTDLPVDCPHPKRMWSNQTDGSAVLSRHLPTTGTDLYSISAKQPSLMRPWKPNTFISSSLTAYPPLLNRYLVAKLISAIRTLPKPVPTPHSKKQCRDFSERVQWRDPPSWDHGFDRQGGRRFSRDRWSP